jgi:hypothetical protein
MKKINMSLFVLILLFGSTTSFAQGKKVNKDSLRLGTIENQFEYVRSVSDNYDQFEVVEIRIFETLKSNVLDSLRTLKEQNDGLKADAKNNSIKFSEMKNELSKAVSAKEEAVENKESISFFGANIHKTFFLVLMTLLIIGFTGFSILFFSRYANSFGKAREAEIALQDVHEEFEKYRKNTIERERKLKRELIDAQMGRDNT